MLVEAVWSIKAAPGPLRAFFQRIQAKKGKQVAAVATARKLAVLIWHMLTKQEDYAWARPALLQWKLRELELKAGQLARLELRHRVQIAFRIVWMHERGCVGPLELLPRISRQLAERPVDAQEATLEITSNAHQPESDRRILEGCPRNCT